MARVSWFGLFRYLYNLNSKIVITLSIKQDCMCNFLKFGSLKYINGL